MINIKNAIDIFEDKLKNPDTTYYCIKHLTVYQNTAQNSQILLDVSEQKVTLLEFFELYIECFINYISIF